MGTPKMTVAGEKVKARTRAATSARSNTGTARGAALFVALRKILDRHADSLVVTRNVPGDYSLDARTNDASGKPLFFGSVRTSRSHTSFYLGPIASSPELLETVSPRLRERMQGKACFNFKTIETSLFEELAALTTTAFDRWKAAGKLG